MKNFKYLLVMFIALSVSVSCSDDDDSGSVDAIVGDWVMSEAEGDIEISILASFKENGKGTLVTTFVIGEQSETENSTFTWSTEGDQLTLVIDGDSEVSTYSISGNTLTITDDEGFELELTRD